MCSQYPQAAIRHPERAQWFLFIGITLVYLGAAALTEQLGELKCAAGELAAELTAARDELAARQAHRAPPEGCGT